MMLAATLMIGGALLAIVFTWIAVDAHRRDGALDARGVETSGTVSHVSRRAGRGCGEGNVVFSDKARQQHQFRSECGDLHDNDKVKVVYLPDDPGVARVRDQLRADVSAALVALASAVAAIGGLVIALRARRPR